MQPLKDPEHILILRETLQRFIEDHMPRNLAREWDEKNEFPR